jgi:hypothetical protein
MNWQPVATISAPIIAFFIGFAVNRWLEKRPKLLSFRSHANAVQVNPPSGAPFRVHTHSVVVRNAGRASASNVRLAHEVLPSNFSVYPSVEYSVVELPGGGADIVFPKLVPGEQVSVTYLYYPPTLADHVNTGCRSDEGFAKIVTVLWFPQRPLWQRATALVLMSAGVVGILSVVYFVAARLWSSAFGP